MNLEEAENIIKTILGSLGVDVTEIVRSVGGAQPQFMVRTPDSGMLIGKNGEHLRAFNIVVRRILEKRLDLSHETPFLIDVNGYYSKRIRELKAQATLLADRARLFKTDVAMNPMNPYERMIVHALFTDDPDLKTESEGEGRTRHIVIRFRGGAEKTTPSDNALFES
jgi:spoIIIJ-associated protein